MALFLRVEAVPITKAAATRFSNMLSVPCERDLKGARLSQLDSAIAGGKIKVFNWAIAHVGQWEYRVNGHHTAHLFSNGTAIPPGATAVIEHYKCETVEEASELWRMFDASISSRTRNENLSVFCATVSEFSNIPKRILFLAQSALCMERHGEGYVSKVSSEGKNICLYEGRDFVQWFSTIPPLNRVSAPGNVLEKVGVAYALLKTWRKDPNAATAFWGQVSTGMDEGGAGLHPMSGPGHLREILLSSDAKNGVGMRTGRPKLQWDAFTKYCVICWNLWRRVAHTKKLVITKNIPDVE